MGFFVALGLSVSYAFLRLTGHSLGDAWQIFAAAVPGPRLIDVLVAVPVAFVMLILASVVGTTAYIIPVILLDIAIAALSFIERHTASGVVGILGFLTFLAGAAVKGYVYWLGV